MEQATKTLQGSDARDAVTKGVKAVCDPVAKTFGPEGKNALLFRTFNRGHRITNDGHAVAQLQEPKDEHERLVAAAVKEAASKTNARAGDGTTGTLVLLRAIYLEALKRIQEGTSTIKTQTTGHGMGVMSLRKQILDEAVKVKDAIKAAAIPAKTLEDLEKIATVSVEDAELGKTIAKMAWDIGTDGFIDVVEGHKGEIETDLIKGMRFPAKVPARAFVNRPEKYEMVVQDAPVVITNYALDNPRQLSFTQQMKVSKLIIFAPSFSEQVLLALVAAVKNGFHVFPVAVPSLRTEQLEDLAIYCKARFINKDKNNRLESTKEDDLGFLEKLVVKETEAKEDAVATGGAGTREEDFYEGEGKEKVLVKSTAVKERITTLKSQMDEQKTEAFRKLFERRIASMYSGVGVIKVGAASDSELYYKKLKIEDAVYSCRAALRGGFVKGGGLCLKEIAANLPDDSILKPALEAPYNQIRENAERDLEITEDIIDPAEAIYWSVENATSVVAHLITVEVITVEIQPKDQADSLDAIAAALNFANRLTNKQHSIYRENQLEMEGDRIRLINELEASDNG